MIRAYDHDKEQTESDYDSYNHQGKRRDQLEYSESVLSYIVIIIFIGLIWLAALNL